MLRAKKALTNHNKKKKGRWSGRYFVANVFHFKKEKGRKRG
jgi:hypothetical protein